MFYLGLLYLVLLVEHVLELTVLVHVVVWHQDQVPCQYLVRP